MRPSAVVESELEPWLHKLLKAPDPMPSPLAGAQHTHTLLCVHGSSWEFDPPEPICTALRKNGRWIQGSTRGAAWIVVPTLLDGKRYAHKARMALRKAAKNVPGTTIHSATCRWGDPSWPSCHQ